MEVKVISEDSDYGEYSNLEIFVDGKSKVNFNYQFDCPEDNTPNRNFADIYYIPHLMKLAYEAGKRGEDFQQTNIEKKYGWDN